MATINDPAALIPSISQKLGLGGDELVLLSDGQAELKYKFTNPLLAERARSVLEKPNSAMGSGVKSTYDPNTRQTSLRITKSELDLLFDQKKGVIEGAVGTDLKDLIAEDITFKEQRRELWKQFQAAVPSEKLIYKSKSDAETVIEKLNVYTMRDGTSPPRDLAKIKELPGGRFKADVDPEILALVKSSNDPANNDDTTTTSKKEKSLGEYVADGDINTSPVVTTINARHQKVHASAQAYEGTVTNINQELDLNFTLKGDVYIHQAENPAIAAQIAGGLNEFKPGLATLGEKNQIILNEKTLEAGWMWSVQEGVESASTRQEYNLNLLKDQLKTSRAQYNSEVVSLLNTSAPIGKVVTGPWIAAQGDNDKQTVFIPQGKEYGSRESAQKDADALNKALELDDKKGFAVTTVDGQSYVAISPRRLGPLGTADRIRNLQSSPTPGTNTHMAESPAPTQADTSATPTAPAGAPAAPAASTTTATAASSAPSETTTVATASGTPPASAAQPISTTEIETLNTPKGPDNRNPFIAFLENNSISMLLSLVGFGGLLLTGNVMLAAAATPILFAVSSWLQFDGEKGAVPQWISPGGSERQKALDTSVLVIGKDGAGKETRNEHGLYLDKKGNVTTQDQAVLLIGGELKEDKTFTPNRFQDMEDGKPVGTSIKIIGATPIPILRHQNSDRTETIYHVAPQTNVGPETIKAITTAIRAVKQEREAKEREKDKANLGGGAELGTMSPQNTPPTSPETSKDTPVPIRP